MMIHDLLGKSAREYPDKFALICDSEKWTYAQLDTTTTRLASSLLDLGVQPGSRVIIFLDNSCETILSIFAVLKIRAVFVVLNPQMPLRKLRYIIEDAGAVLIVTDNEKLIKTRQALDDLQGAVRILLCYPASAPATGVPPKNASSQEAFFVDACSAGANTLPRSVSRGTSIDLAAIIYTSGSTGVPKGVVSTHLNVVSAVESINEYLQNTADDVVLNMLPFSFDYGLYQIFLMFACGGTLVVEKRFGYPYSLIEKLASRKISGLPIVPTIAAALTRMDTSRFTNTPNLRYLTNTGDVLPVAFIRHLQALFPGAKIFSMYGLTECKRVSYLPPSQIDKRPDSVGIPMPNCEVEIVDNHDQPVACGQIGELVVRGPNVMQGYWNYPEDTRCVFRPGAYRMDARLYTGDLFRMDKDGYLYFVSRKDDLLKIRSERVSPKEIENLLHEIEGVAEAAVAVSTDRYGEKYITAIVVAANGKSISAKDILKACTDGLEPHLVPKEIKFLNHLPKNENGKIDRSRLCHFLAENC